jgi:tRNA G18 (ribose-2'-O)-methylase SpoU
MIKKNITDINDEDIVEFISLKQAVTDKERVVVESKNVFKKLFQTDITIHKLFITQKNIDFINEYCNKINFPIYTASDELMKKIVGHKVHQGMMAVIEKPRYIKFDEICGNIVVLNGLTSPENVGSIVRSCAAFGALTIVIDEKTCSPFLRRCIRVSTGNLFNIKVYKSKNLKNDLIALRDNGYHVISTANTKDAISLDKFSFPRKSAIIIGSEGHGIEEEVLKLSDTVLKIDIDEEVTSLNASIVAAIILYKIKGKN